jgi:RNA polymerase sigma factor (sigma-70 family)
VQYSKLDKAICEMIKQSKKVVQENKDGHVCDDEPRVKRNVFSYFKQHEAALRRYISSFFITSQDIDDISQETFLRSFESNIKSTIRQPKSFMYCVAKNLILSKYRRSSYKLTDYIEDLEDHEEPLDISNLENDIDAQHTLSLFCEGLASLPEQCRRVVVMRKVYGLSINEIAERLDMPTSTINWNIAKGMTHCDNLIEKHENSGVSQAKNEKTNTDLNVRSINIGRRGE